MPQVRKLSAAEVQALTEKPQGQRRTTEALYDTMLRDYAAGDYGEAILEDGDNRLTIRNRLRAAARRQGLGMVFRRTAGDLIRFHLIELAAAPPPAPAAPPTARTRVKRASV